MKSLLLLFVMFFTSISVYSQLFVRPNPTSSTDSYVYVKDQVLFVEQDVNLELNTNDATTKASIYLRDESQLIQGNTGSANSGSGYLSVYQETPDDDSWDYTYWHSPVGHYITGSGNENFGIWRIHDSLSVTNAIVANNTHQYNGTVSPLVISRRWIYMLPPGNEVESDYVYVGFNNNVPAGMGFTMKGVGTSNHLQRYDFRGRPYNGIISVPVEANKMTLSGNPYASAIDLKLVFADNNSLLNNIRFWDEDRSIDSHLYSDNRAGYGTWIPGTAADPYGVYTAPTFIEYASGGVVGGSSGTGADYNRRNSPIGQGFLYYANSTGTVIVNNSHRVYVKESDTDGGDFRSNEGGDSTDPSQSSSTPQMRIITSFGETHSRDMLLMFWEDSTNGYDVGLDAKHPLDGDHADAYFPIAENLNEVITEREPYVIQTLPFGQDKKIPFAFTLDAQTDISVHVVQRVNFTKDAYLWDKVENTIAQITGEDNNATLTLPAGVYDERFYIVFNSYRETLLNSEGTLAQENVRSNIDFFQNNRVKQLEISNPEGYTIQSANVFDMAGKLVISKSNIGSDSNITLSTSILSDGVYLIMLKTDDNIDIDYKMVIENK